MPRTAEYDQRITIRRKVISGRNDLNEPIYGEPETVCEVWAKVGFLQGREYENAQQRWPEANYKIEMRRQPGATIRRDDEIAWNGQTLDILDVRGPGTRMNVWTITAQDRPE